MVKTDKRSELEATLIAAFVTLGCLVFFGVIAKPEKRPEQQPPPPPKISTVPVAARQSWKESDHNQQFREIPARWLPIDFKRRSYGSYKFSYGRRINLTLKNGQYEYGFKESQGWFSLTDVYYVDVTGDQIPEAIVDLSHVKCGDGSCDGGADLLFIYSINFEGELRELWQFETGSYAYGYGLKSLTLNSEEVQLELFGCCRESAMNYVSPGKFLVEGLTKMGFRYTDKGFINKKIEFDSTPVTDVKNYRAEVHINK